MADRRLGNAALAKAVGISHVAVGNYLDGRLPRAEELLAIADHFGVSTDYLLGRDSAMSRGASPPADVPAGSTPGIPPGSLAAALAGLDEIRARCAEAGELLERALAEAALIRDMLESHEAGGGVSRGAGATRAKGSAAHADLQGRRVSVKDTLPGVEAAVKDRVRDGALRAMRLSRGKGSPDKGSTGGTSGSKGGPSKESAPA
jgi:transcriptional regulator with XRE-family HTH domain